MPAMPARLLLTLLHTGTFQARRLWGQLVSMRTALVLLFLLAVAAVPGATFPQREISPAEVAAYYREHPTLAPILDRLWGFDVFSSPWFAAIYLLLFVSLTGCLISRVRVHLLPLITGPPPAPAQFSKLPLHATAGPATGTPAELADAVRARLRDLRWRRVRRSTEPSGAITLSAERGQLRELGNLVFHFALLAVLIGVAVGGLWGWKGGALIVEDSQFCNTVQSYDQFQRGHLVADDAITPFCLSMSDFRAEYLPNGQPVRYEADVRYQADISGDGPGAGATEPRTPYTLEVNRPLRMDGAGVFLINHGYAPMLRYTDRYGTSFESPTPFLPKDSGLSSEGVVVLPDANQDPSANQDPNGQDSTPNMQVAFEGVYVPTAPPLPPYVRSEYPARRDEGITLLAYQGDTGLDSGIPRSVYSLDQQRIAAGDLNLVGSAFLRPGETWKLDDGSQVTFVGTKQWMSVEVSHDPGRLTALGGAVAMVLGLLISLFTRRRRLFVRCNAVAGTGGTTIELAGLTRADSETFTAEFGRIVDAVREIASPPPR